MERVFRTYWVEIMHVDVGGNWLFLAVTYSACTRFFYLHYAKKTIIIKCSYLKAYLKTMLKTELSLKSDREESKIDDWVRESTQAKVLFLQLTTITRSVQDLRFNLLFGYFSTFYLNLDTFVRGYELSPCKYHLMLNGLRRLE